MLPNIPLAVASPAVFFISFALWIITFLKLDFGDWSLVVLIPLSVFLFKGSYRLSLDNWKAKFGLMVKEQSRVYPILNGKMIATITALFFSFSSIAVLAWQTVQGSTWDLIIIAFFTIMSNIVYLFCKGIFQTHLHDPFDRSLSGKVTTAIVAPICFLSLWYSSWGYHSHSGLIAEATAYQAIEIGLSQLPNQNSIFSYFLAVPFVHETLKIWGLMQFKGSPYFLPISLIVCLDAALISFLLVRTNVILIQSLPQLIIDFSDDAQEK